MTTSLPQQNTIVQYTANGTQNTFVFAFYVPEDGDLGVYVTPENTTPIEAQDIQALNTAYTVTYNADPTTGGYITFATNYIPAVGATVTLNRDVQASLTTNFASVQTFSGANLDYALNRLLLLIQQNQSYALERNLSYVVNSALLPNTAPFTQLQPLASGYVWMGSSTADGGVVAVYLDQNTNFTTFRTELSNNAPSTNGAALVGYYDERNVVGTDVASFLNNLPTYNQTYYFESGAVKQSLNPAILSGWINWTTGSIGNAASSGTIRANADTLNLFTVLWTNYNNSQCPVSGGRGSSAVADFAANKNIGLPTNGNSGHWSIKL